MCLVSCKELQNRCRVPLAKAPVFQVPWPLPPLDMGSFEPRICVGGVSQGWLDMSAFESCMHVGGFWRGVEVEPLFWPQSDEWMEEACERAWSGLRYGDTVNEMIWKELRWCIAALRKCRPAAFMAAEKEWIYGSADFKWGWVQRLNDTEVKRRQLEGGSLKDVRKRDMNVEGNGCRERRHKVGASSHPGFSSLGLRN
ncbi:hypothetical protein B0H17DRAFT_1154071 [Mycena rosella]|uniref:Uncharacterized protein n=1 Tax=Mycena rosella TaxID=1033263 RepID=A0AAD7F753_MYCRO|nr:hypothetical protein B0H17DRAFT_1154071 [Mycena rosella]